MPAAEVELKITNGAELVAKLAATGTGEAKLAVARKHLGFIHRSENRVASAAELLDVLAKEFGEEHMSVRKARCIAETGEWAGPIEMRNPPIEQILMGNTAPIVVREKVAEPDPEPENPEGKKEDKKPEGLKGLEPEGHSSAPPVGPLPVAKKK